MINLYSPSAIDPEQVARFSLAPAFHSPGGFCIMKWNFSPANTHSFSLQDLPNLSMKQELRRSISVLTNRTSEESSLLRALLTLYYSYNYHRSRSQRAVNGLNEGFLGGLHGNRSG